MGPTTVPARQETNSHISGNIISNFNTKPELVNLSVRLGSQETPTLAVLILTSAPMKISTPVVGDSILMVWMWMSLVWTETLMTIMPGCPLERLKMMDTHRKYIGAIINEISKGLKLGVYY